MLRRSTRLLLEIIAVLIAGVAIVALLIVWRFSTGEPVRLRFLTAYLEQALNPTDAAYRITIEDTVLTWEGWDRALDLRARGVRTLVGGRPVAAVPELAVTLSLRALLRGQVAPTGIEVFGPRLRMVRERDGRFRFVQALIGDGIVPAAEDPVLPRLLTTLSSPPKSDSLLSYLTRASILGADIEVEDRRAGTTWHAPSANVTLRRSEDGLSGTVALALEGLGTPARFSATVTYSASRGVLSMTGSFSDVDALALGLIDAHLTVLDGANLKLAGRLDAVAGLDGIVQSARFEVTGGAGAFSLPAWYDEPLLIRSISARGSFDGRLDRLVIESAALQLDGPVLTLAGSLTGLLSGDRPGTEIAIEGRLAATEVEVASLPRYWPRDAAANPRSWVVANMHEGVIYRAEAEFALRLPQADPERTIIDRFETTLEGTGLSLQYLGGLPPIRGTTGKARITDQEMTAEFSGGGVGALTIEQSTLRISQFEEKDQVVEIDGVVHGPLRDALELLNRPRLGYPRKVGLDPATASGEAKTRLTFRFLAEKDLRFEDVAMKAVSDLTDVDLGKAKFGQSISEGAFHLDLDTRSMTVSGKASVGGIPATLTWTERFERGSEFDSRIEAVATTTPAQREGLGLDLRPYLNGPVPTKLVYTRYGPDRSTVDLDLDLGQAEMALPFLGWSKAADEPGRALMAIDLAQGQLSGIRSFDVKAGTLAASGRGRLAGAAADADRFEFDRLDVGETRLRNVVLGIADGRTDVTVGGGQIDARPSLAEDDQSGESRLNRPFTFQAPQLERIILGEGRELTGVSASLRHDAAWWDEIVLNATLPGGKPLQVRYQPRPDGRHRLAVDSPDAGAALRAFGIIDTVVGGSLKIRGTAKDDAPDRPLEGEAEIRDFRLVRAPVLARLLSIATLTGLVDVLTGEGFLFTRFTADFTKTGGRLEIPLARAYGPSVGLTATGTADFDANTVDVQGTVVPAYAINSLLGNIPIIGDLLMGGKGQGLFAATYRATGSLDEPDISVNPLAALAPGFLRGLFDVFERGGEPIPPRALPEPGSNR